MKLGTWICGVFSGAAAVTIASFCAVPPMRRSVIRKARREYRVLKKLV